MRKKFLILTGVFVAAVIGASFNFGGQRAEATVPGTNTLISVTRTGSAAVASDASGGILSSNGRYFAFSSASSNVVLSDTNGLNDTFVRDLNANTTTRVSLTDTNREANGSSQQSAISETGRYVLFGSTASNLITGMTVPTAYSQLYLRDTVANTTTLLSQNASGVTANADVDGEAISEDGRFVLFTSSSTNLGPSVTNSGVNVYMLNRSNNSFTILNYKYDGTLPNTIGNPPTARMSCDGSLIAFTAPAALTSTPSSHLNVYLLDRRAGNKLTSLTVAANGAAGAPTVSCNGNYIGFTSSAYNLDPAFTSNPSTQYHAYVYDRINATYGLADKTTGGTVGSTSVSCSVGGERCMNISDNGIAVFPSSSSNLTATGVTNDQIYQHNMLSGATELTSQTSTGAAGNLSSTNPTISTDGSIVGYGSNSTNLVSITDTDNFTDAFTSLTGY